MAGTIVVTGASAGIGRAVAEGFLDAGWNAVLLARRGDLLAEVAAGRAGALPLACDVTDPVAVEAAFDAAVAGFGRIDVLFNNAGISRPAGLIDEIPLADWFDTVAVNLNGMFLCARAAFARMCGLGRPRAGGSSTTATTSRPMRRGRGRSPTRRRSTPSPG